TVVLALDSGTYQVQLRLVSSNGTPLTPAVSASITVALTRGPAGGTPRIAITYWEILYPFPGDLWGDDITISFRISNFTLVPPGRRESVPNEGRLRVLVDGLVFKDITTYEPAHFSDLPDGDHTVTMRLVDGAGQPLNPDASDSTRFRVEGEQKVAPIPDLSPYLLTAQLGLGAAIVGVLYVLVDGALGRVLAQVEPIVLALASGPHTIVLRLVGNDGAPLTPDVSASLRVVATQGPAGSIPTVGIVSPKPDERTGHGVYISFQVSNFTLVEPHGQANAPNEGHLQMILDGSVMEELAQYEPGFLVSLPDGDHVLTMRLANNDDTPLSPDVSASITFQVTATTSATLPLG